VNMVLNLCKAWNLLTERLLASYCTKLHISSFNNSSGISKKWKKKYLFNSVCYFSFPTEQI